MTFSAIKLHGLANPCEAVLLRCDIYALENGPKTISTASPPKSEKS